MSTTPIESVANTMDEALNETLDEVLACYAGKKAELIPILQQVQQALGYLPEEALRRIAHFTRVPESTVFGVATFYSQFRLAPVGRNIIKVCRGTGCYVKGSPRLLDKVEKLLGINDGETTSDLEYTLETVACFGSCALAPVVVLNGKVHGTVTPERLKALLGPQGRTE
jgi:NADH-quinone oxidoreductase subunit E